MKVKLVLACTAAMATMVCLAGAVLQYHCKSCGFKGEVEIGGGFAYGLITGYCSTCTNFVQLRWDRTNQPPQKVGTVWNASSGRFSDLYACPGCKKPFLELKGPELDPPGTNSIIQAFCPRCKKPSLNLEGNLVRD